MKEHTKIKSKLEQKLSSIFKSNIGVLSKVLSYYNHPHIWILLMMNLCLESWKLLDKYNFSTFLTQNRQKIVLNEEEMKYWLKNKIISNPIWKYFELTLTKEISYEDKIIDATFFCWELVKFLNVARHSEIIKNIWLNITTDIDSDDMENILKYIPTKFLPCLNIKLMTFCPLSINPNVSSFIKSLEMTAYEGRLHVEEVEFEHNDK